MAKIQDIRTRTPFGNPTRNLSQIKYIIRHHSATPTGNFDTFYSYWKNSRGWITGGYHEIILRDGTVQLCYNPNQVTNGVTGFNSVAYHICMVGNGSFTAAQEKAWDERVKYNMDRLKVSAANVRGHGEMPNQSTTCPGINMNTVRNRIKNGTSTSPAPDQNTGSHKAGVKWIETNDKGKALEIIAPSVNYYDTQRWSNPTGSRKKGYKWKIDNLYEVNGSLQYRVQDENGNLFFTTARKDLVRVGGGYKGSNKVNSQANLVVDGSWGPATTRALQRHFGTTVDGVISGQPNNANTRNIPSANYGSGGSNLIRGMQKWLYSQVDGTISYPSHMITELQGRLKMKIIDGRISSPSNVVRELQRRLNNGTLK